MNYVIGTYDGIVVCKEHRKFRPCEECGEMPWAHCEWCVTVIGVMWDYDSDVVECTKCGAWLSVERPNNTMEGIEE